MEGNLFVYWEKQENDLLCGLHCLNSLIQAPLFNEISLATIAQQLDKKEEELLGKKVSTNVNRSGNFSFQVLIEALKSMGDFRVESIKSERLKGTDMSNQEGFVCHNDNHWFAIRKIHGQWFNLNSTNPRSPQIISEFYLSVFLDSIQANGYLIFAIDGPFVSYDPSIFLDILSPNKKFFTLQELQKFHELDKKSQNYKLNLGGTDEVQLDRALKESIQ